MTIDPSKTDFFSADRPIRGAGEDRLSRDAFAEHLAQSIASWHGKDSLVLALYGKWGSGKSSVKNMVLEVLEKRKPRPVVVDLNVWQFANRNNLTEIFFDQLGIELGKGSIGTEKQRNAIVRKWHAYATYLNSAGDILSLVRNTGSALFAVAGVSLIGFLFPAFATLSTVIAAISLVLAGTLRFASTFTKSVADILSVRTEKGRRTLEEVKLDVAKTLKELPVPVLVVVDDLDRLTPAETLELLQLVKANADFPNIVYLLLCERAVIENHVKTVLGVAGRDFIEKVVQVPFDIPVIEGMKLRQVLTEGLDVLLADPAVVKRFEKVRWGNIFEGGLRFYFNTLRDVNRYLSTLAFHVSVFSKGKVFEVNPIDLIALETLRVFEPDVYQALARNKDLLTNSLRSWSSSKESKERAAKELLAIIAHAPEERRESAREVITQLFPRAAAILGGMSYGSEWDETWFRELRVCAPDAFDRYFNLTIPAGDLSQSVIDDILEASVDRARLRTLLESLDRQGTLATAIDRFEAYKQQVPLEHSEPFVTALFDIGDRLTADNAGMFEISTEMHAIRIVYWHLQKEKDIQKRGEILKHAVINTTGIRLPVAFIAIEAQRAATPEPGSKGDATIDPSTLAELKVLCTSKIEAAAADGRLATSRNLTGILYRWRDWGGAEAPTAFITRLAQTAPGALIVLRAFLNRSVTTGMSDHVGIVHWFIPLGELESFVSVDSLKKALDGIDVTTISEDDHRAVDAFEKALKRRSAGKPDFGKGVGDEDEDV
jgi:predicted KAP-like P-loop ATPase